MRLETWLLESLKNKLGDHPNTPIPRPNCQLYWPVQSIQYTLVLKPMFQQALVSTIFE